MDHFNAMFEDATTKSWWQQETGKAIAGPLKGTALKEIASKQLTLEAWLREYPNSSVMLPDTSLKKDYNFDKQIVVGTIKVDEHSRLTLSKKIKNVFPIYPGDTIVVYQDLISNNLLFKVQRLNEVSDTWIIKRQYNDAASSFSSDNNNVIFYDKSVSTNNYHNGENVQQLVEHTFNIMIVDDNSDILDFYKDFFLFSIGSKNDEKYFIETFSSAAEALKRFVDV